MSDKEEKVKKGSKKNKETRGATAICNCSIEEYVRQCLEDIDVKEAENE
ncbi:MAG: hypothetical protein SVE93_00515 [Candidatus Thermoplasmatota archaeon]|nr:hypothetical protein [Candidatus Thermoplasmatota archaeon]